MNKLKRTSAGLAIAAIVVTGQGCQGPPAADLVFFGGKIVTLSDESVTEALAVKGERIVAFSISPPHHGPPRIPSVPNRQVSG